jgi:hypothetical protein
MSAEISEYFRMLKKAIGKCVQGRNLITAGRKEIGPAHDDVHMLIMKPYSDFFLLFHI